MQVRTAPFEQGRGASAAITKADLCVEMAVPAHAQASRRRLHRLLFPVQAAGNEQATNKVSEIAASKICIDTYCDCAPSNRSPSKTGRGDIRCVSTCSGNDEGGRPRPGLRHGLAQCRWQVDAQAKRAVHGIGKQQEWPTALFEVA